VCMLAYSSRRNVPTCTRLGSLIPRDQKENTDRQNSEKNSIPGEGDLRSSELSTIEECRQEQS
jgi:hypothetical protein